MIARAVESNHGQLEADEDDIEIASERDPPETYSVKTTKRCFVMLHGSA